MNKSIILKSLCIIFITVLIFSILSTIYFTYFHPVKSYLKPQKYTYYQILELFNDNKETFININSILLEKVPYQGKIYFSNLSDNNHRAVFFDEKSFSSLKTFYNFTKPIGITHYSKQSVGYHFADEERENEDITIYCITNAMSIGYHKQHYRIFEPLGDNWFIGCDSLSFHDLNPS